MKTLAAVVANQGAIRFDDLLSGTHLPVEDIEGLARLSMWDALMSVSSIPTESVRMTVYEAACALLNQLTYGWEAIEDRAAGVA